MYRIFLALAAASVLSACEGAAPTVEQGVGIGTGTQPLTEEESQDDIAPETPLGDRSPVNVYGDEADADLTMNDMKFDPATGELVLNNLPFDGDDNLYTRDAALSSGLQAGGSSFDVYTNVDGRASYYAVFRRSDSGYSQVGAAATDRYLGFGFGGVSAQRLRGNGRLPNANQAYLFTGEYAAVRTVDDPTTGTQVQYVAGTVEIDVDIQDFDVSGAVEGVIVDRRFFDENGVRIASLDNADFVSLATADIDFSDWTIMSSQATSVVRGESGASGTWEGLFTGPNGEEVAGIVVMEGEGPVGIDPATGDYILLDVRETGGFIATR